MATPRLSFPVPPRRIESVMTFRSFQRSEPGAAGAVYTLVAQGPITLDCSHSQTSHCAAIGIASGRATSPAASILSPAVVPLASRCPVSSGEFRARAPPSTRGCGALS
eukprot:5797926-Prymnesium_polylepis.1